MPDEPTPDGSTPTPSDETGNVPASQPDPQTMPDEDSGSPPVEPSGQDDADFVSIMDAAKELGYNVDGLDDDAAVVRKLVEEANQARQVQPYLPQLQDYLQHASAFEEFRREQGQPQSAQPQAPTESKEEPLWNAPEFNPMWLGLVQSDGQGGIVPNVQAGGTPAIAQKVQEYFTWRGQQQDRFWQDPFSFMEPYLERRDQKLRESLQEEYSQRSSHSQEERDARDFIEQNRGWLYEADEQGVIRTHPATGRPMFTQAGEIFAQAIQEAEQMGLPPANQRYYALRMLQASGVTPQQPSGQQPAAETPGQPAPTPEASDAQRKQDFLANAAGATPSTGASTNRSPDQHGNTQPQNERLTLDEMMRQDLQAAGITDKQLAEGY